MRDECGVVSVGSFRASKRATHLSTYTHSGNQVHVAKKMDTLGRSETPFGTWQRRFYGLYMLVSFLRTAVSLPPIRQNQNSVQCRNDPDPRGAMRGRGVAHDMTLLPHLARTIGGTHLEDRHLLATREFHRVKIAPSENRTRAITMGMRYSTTKLTALTHPAYFTSTTTLNNHVLRHLGTYFCRTTTYRPAAVWPVAKQYGAKLEQAMLRSPASNPM